MEEKEINTKIALAQINPIPADIEYNKNKIIENIKNAISQNAGLIIFPNLAIYGYCRYNMLKKFPYLMKLIS